MSINIENLTDASKTCGTKEFEKSISRISPELIEEGMRTNLKHFNVQISTLTQLLNELIQDNFAKTTQAAGLRTHRLQAGPLFNREIGASGTSPDTAIGRKGLSPDSGCLQ